ncbi:homogentisate 1,2-dioxygenase-like [Cimex lectularius]|uniref:Homogentisate 1,2-dioxygenase N-terminal domain-containing protein n=1 Tax=Cimex lectularius TaxID=79782 RepID=A0A8I6SEV1_CIMLE|nr:homogentisate 1,2-dioxygenase-like [Cimex lectularius]
MSLGVLHGDFYYAPRERNETSWLYMIEQSVLHLPYNKENYVFSPKNFGNHEEKDLELDTQSPNQTRRAPFPLPPLRSKSTGKMVFSLLMKKAILLSAFTSTCVMCQCRTKLSIIMQW